MRKRSRTVALAIVGAASFTLAGCRDEQVDAQAFPDLESCKSAAVAGGLFSSAECDTAFAEAEALHVEAAPRYDSLAVCEEQHGEGACGSEEQVAERGSGAAALPQRGWAVYQCDRLQHLFQQFRPGKDGQFDVRAPAIDGGQGADDPR